MDLLTYYSNRPDLRDDLGRVADQLRAELAREPLGASDQVSVRSVQPEPKIWRVADRLAENEVHAIVERFEQGTPKHILAKEYGLSLSSIKNLLRKNKARQPWQVSDRLGPQDVRALLGAYEEGTPQSKLAERYGVGLSTVARLCQSHGVIRRGRKTMR